MFIEFCGGGALDSIMVDLEKPMTEAQIRYVCHEMCQALDFLHRHHVIHRDIKAGNVLLTMDGEVKLGEWLCLFRMENQKICGHDMTATWHETSFIVSAINWIVASHD